MSQHTQARRHKSLPARPNARSRTAAGHHEDPTFTQTFLSNFCICFHKMNERVLEPSTVRILRPLFRRIPYIDSWLRKDKDHTDTLSRKAVGRKVTVPRTAPKYRRPKSRRQLELISRNSGSARHQPVSYLHLSPLDTDGEDETTKWDYAAKAAPRPGHVVSIPSVPSMVDVNLNPVGHESSDWSSRPSTAEDTFVSLNPARSESPYMSSRPTTPEEDTYVNLTKGTVEYLDFPCKLTTEEDAYENLNAVRYESGSQDLSSRQTTAEEDFALPSTRTSALDHHYQNLPTVSFSNPLQPPFVEFSTHSDCQQSHTNNKIKDGRVELENFKLKLKSSTRLLQKSSSVFFNWGKVSSLFIPMSGDTPTRKGLSFPMFERAIDAKALELKHVRAAVARERILEKKAVELLVRRQDWEKRRLIGLYQKTIRIEKGVPKVKLTGELESRFHYIHSFFRCNDQMGSNQVGRYFDMENKTLVAIKIYGAKFGANVKEKLHSKLSAFSEIDALMKMNHSNIVRMLAYFELEGRIHLILDVCDHSLRTDIEKAPKGLDTRMARKLVHQILAALSFCHSIGCLHLDISPENLLLTSDGVLKLADFDKSVFLHSYERRLSLTPGTIVYGAPELLGQKENCGFASDVWSVGCVFVELLRGIPLWNYPTAEEQLTRITKSYKPTFPEYPDMITCCSLLNMGPVRTLRGMLASLADDSLAFVSELLELEPHRRSTCGHLLGHPYLNINRDRVEKAAKSDSITEAILPGSSLYYHTQRALTPAELEPYSSTDAYDSEDCPISSRSGVSPIEWTDQWYNKYAVKSEDGSSKSELNATKVKDSPGAKKGKRNIRLKRSKQKESKHSAIVLKRDHSTDRSAGSYVVSNDERPGTETDRSRKSLRPKRSPCRQSSLDPGSTAGHRTEFDPNLRKELTGRRKVSVRVSMTDIFTLSSSQMCAMQRAPTEVVPANVPATSRQIMRHIINTLPEVTWGSCRETCGHLNRLNRIAPKMFKSQAHALVTAILEQIALPRSIVAGPAIKILRTIYKFAPKPLEDETERVLDGIMQKVGGPAFIDRSCFHVIREITSFVHPVRVCTHLAKIGPKHPMAVGRAVGAMFLCETIGRLDIKTELGNSSPSKRRFTRIILKTAAQYNRDTHAPSRAYAKYLFRLLSGHPQFWKLYMEFLPYYERDKLDKVMEGIRSSKIPYG